MTLRNILFQIHLWVGLSLGVLFVVIGLSGAVLMFRATPGSGQRVPAMQATAKGALLPLEEIAARARAGIAVPEDAAATIIPPQAEGMPAEVRFARPGIGRGPSRGAQSPDVLVDPVSGKLLGTFTPGMTSWMRFFHDMHGQLFLGRSGRLLVGWLGVGMTFLGFSGLYLWWPRKGQWKYAFKVRREAKGVRFHRELHGAVGIWSLVVFLIVSFSGVAIVFPQTIRAGLSLVVADDAGTVSPMQGGAPRRDGPPGGGRGILRVPTVAAAPRLAAITADKAVAAARRANPDLPLRSVTLAARPGQAITVTMGTGRGVPVFVDPYRAVVIGQPARALGPMDKVSLVMRQLHAGEGLGPVYWVAVLLSGVLPALFVFTGLMMWIKKRRNRLAVRQVGAEALEPTR